VTDTTADSALNETIAQALSIDEQRFDLSPLGFVNADKIAKKEAKVFEKYKALLNDLTREEELEIMGISLNQVFPPIERDVEKLMIDLNMVIYAYMQKKMETDQETRVEIIRSTVLSSLRKVSAALLTMGAEDK
jgi:ABC-type Na+ transport system ATPase subunit NatA